jgi:hypothetical protein
MDIQGSRLQALSGKTSAVMAKQSAKVEGFVL